MKMKQHSCTCKNSHYLNNLLEENHPIQYDLAESTTMLGLVLVNRHKWSSHSFKVCSKMSSGIFAIQMLCPLGDLKPSYLYTFN